jgi:hypothetical protein
MQKAIDELREDHGRVVSIVFELQNMEIASKNQHHMLNDRLIVIAKEIETLLETVIELGKHIKSTKEKRW